VGNSIYDILPKTVNSSDTEVIHVLYVDDETGLQKVVKQMLEMRRGFQVETVASVEEANKKLAKEEYDVIVSDYQMPNQSGLDFLEYLRARGDEIPFILFTGKGREEVAIEALNLGADHYINKIGKPETVFGELSHAIQQVSHKRAAERKLKILSEVVEQSSNSIAVMDKHGKIVYVNKKLLEAYGFKSKDIVGKIFGSWVQDSPTMREKMREIAIRIHKHKKGWSGELSNVLDSGEIIWRNAKIFPLFDEYEAFSYIAYSGEDITQQKQMKEALYKSEKRFRELSELLPEVIYEVDFNGNIVFANKEAYKIFGYSQEEFNKGLTAFQMIASQNSDKVKENFARVMRGENIGIQEYTAIRKDGSTFPMLLHSTPIRHEEKIVGIRGIMVDITDRKKKEEELRESEEKFRNLADQSPNMIFINQQGKIVYVNKKCKEIMGYTEPEFYSPDFDFLTLIATEDRKLIKSSFLKHLKGDDVPPYEYSILTKEGQRIDAILTTKLISFKGKSAILGTVTDITERKQSEVALKEAMIKLEQLNNKMKMLCRLTMHDAKNKLAIISNNIFLAKQQLEANPNMSEYLIAVESATEQIEKIFEFSRIYEILGTEKLFDVNVKKSIDEAFMLFTHSNKIKLENECENLTVKADSLLRQLFYNLFDNSLTHGKNVSQIKVYYQEKKDHIKLVYEDNGVGISVNEKEKIFKEGYGRGTGLGLHLIRNICETYGWTIKETGTLGIGAQFTIKIPKNNYVLNL